MSVGELELRLLLIVHANAAKLQQLKILVEPMQTNGHGDIVVEVQHKRGAYAVVLFHHFGF